MKELRSTHIQQQQQQQLGTTYEVNITTYVFDVITVHSNIINACVGFVKGINQSRSKEFLSSSGGCAISIKGEEGISVTDILSSGRSDDGRKGKGNGGEFHVWIVVF
jgi:hypothetical protein